VSRCSLSRPKGRTLTEGVREDSTGGCVNRRKTAGVCRNVYSDELHNLDVMGQDMLHICGR
jgi:hypothetical protein